MVNIYWQGESDSAIILWGDAVASWYVPVLPLPVYGTCIILVE